jgi:hypothetical protein
MLQPIRYSPTSVCPKGLGTFLCACLFAVCITAGEDLPDGLDEPEKGEQEGRPAADDTLGGASKGGGWQISLRWVLANDTSRSLDGLWREDDSFSPGRAIVVAWPTDKAGFHGPGATAVKRFDDAPKGSESLTMPTAEGVWKLERGTHRLFPGDIPFEVGGEGIKPKTKEVAVLDEKGQEVFAIKTYPVALELRGPAGELLAFPPDALLYGKEPVLPKMRAQCLTARIYLPKSHDPGVPYRFRVQGGQVSFHVGPKGIEVVQALGVQAEVDGEILVARYPRPKSAPGSVATGLARPFDVPLSGKDARAAAQVSSRLWGAEDKLEVTAPGNWQYDFTLTEPRGDGATKLKCEKRAAGVFLVERPGVGYTLGRLVIVGRRAGEGGQETVVEGAGHVFLIPRERCALSLLKRNMGRRAYLTGEEIELYLLGRQVKAAGDVELVCRSETGQEVTQRVPRQGRDLNERPMVVGFDTSFLAAGNHTLQARLGDLASNPVEITLVDDVFDSDYLTLAYYKYPSVYGTTSSSLIAEMADRHVNTLIANYDGRGPSFGRPACLADPWERLDPLQELSRHATEAYLEPDAPTALMDVCTQRRMNYLNFGHMINWCIFGHREDDAEYRRQAIIRAYQLRQFPSFIGVHYTDNDLPCVPGQGLTGGPGWHSDARAGWRMQRFNKEFTEKYGKPDASLGPAVPDEALSKVDIDQALNLAASARFSENPKVRQDLQKTVEGLDRSRSYFRAYHLIWGDLIGGAFRRDVKAMSPQLLVSNATNDQYPEYYFHSFDCAVNSLMTDYGIIPLHNWSGVDLLHLGKMRQKVVFDAIRPCIIHFDRLLFQSLARQPDGLGYGFTGVETMEWGFHPDWRRRCLYSYSFLKRYGSAVAQCRTANEVVVLDSETMCAVSGGMHPAVYYRAHYALTRGGIPVQLMTENDIAQGRLRGQAALLLVNQQMPLPTKTVKAIEAFAAEGGKVYGDADALIRLPESARRIDVRFTDYYGFGFDGGSEFAAMDAQSIPRGKKVAEELAKDIAFDVRDGNPHVLTRLFHGPDVRYLIAIAEATHEGHVVQHGWPGHREKVTLRKRPAEIIDLIDWERAPVAEDGSFEVDFGPYTARLYALLPEPIGGLSADVGHETRPGRQNGLRIVPKFASGKPVQSPVPLDVCIRSPGGAVRQRFLRTVSAEQPAVEFPLGEDEPPGRWQAEVTELVSGNRVRGEFKVGEAERHDRVRAFNDVVVHDAQPLEQFLKATKGIEIALDYRQAEFRNLVEAAAARLRAAGCDIGVRVVRESECRQYPSRWWYEPEEQEQIRPVEAGEAIGVRVKGAGLKGSFKVEDDNFRELHLESITPLKYKRNLILIDTNGNWLYEQVAAMLTHQPTGSFPGKGQAVVQMIWAPFDTDYNAVVVNTRDGIGLEQALKTLEAAAAGQEASVATFARPAPRFTHPRFAKAMGKAGTGTPAIQFVPLEAVEPGRAEDNGVVKPSIYQIYFTSADRAGRFCLAASGIGNVGFDGNLRFLWKILGLDVLGGPIDQGRLVGAVGGRGVVLNPDFSTHLSLEEAVPFAVSQDGRVFGQRKNNTFAWSADGTLLWKKSLVGEALYDPGVFRTQGRHIAVDRRGRYVAASKAWTKEEHGGHFCPYLAARDAATGRLLWHAPIATSGLWFTEDGERLVVIEGAGRGGSDGGTSVRVVEPATGRILWQAQFGGSGNVAPAIHPAANQVVAAVAESQVRSVSPEQEFNWSLAVPSVVNCLRFSPDGEHLGYSTVYDELTLLDRRGKRVAVVNCSGTPSFAWKSNDEVFLASERGHLGVARVDGTVLASDRYTKYLEKAAVPLSEARHVARVPPLYDTPFLEVAKALKPRTVSVGFEGSAVSAADPGKWPVARLDAPKELRTAGPGKGKHERHFVVFRARAPGKADGRLSLKGSQDGATLFGHHFSVGQEFVEYVVGLPPGGTPLALAFQPNDAVELAGPAVVALPFEFPNLARMYPVEQTAGKSGLEQYVADITLVTEARCINFENLPADGDYFQLLNGRLYDTGHWLTEKLLTVHDYVVRRKTTSVVNFGSPIPVDIRLKHPLPVHCVIAHHVPGEPNSPTADMAVEVWDTVAARWRLVGYREDNRDLSSVFVFDPVTTNRVRYWLLAGGNGRYGVSEVEIFGPTDPGMGALDRSEDVGGDENDEKEGAPDDL